MQRDLRERIERRRIIWVEFLNKDMKRKGWEKVTQGDPKGKDQKAANKWVEFLNKVYAKETEKK